MAYMMVPESSGLNVEVYASQTASMDAMSHPVSSLDFLKGIA